MSWKCFTSALAPFKSTEWQQGTTGCIDPGEGCRISPSPVKRVLVDCYTRHCFPFVFQRRQVSIRSASRLALKQDWKARLRVGHQTFGIIDRLKEPLRNGCLTVLNNAASTDRASLDECIPDLDPSPKQVGTRRCSLFKFSRKRRQPAEDFLTESLNLIVDEVPVSTFVLRIASKESSQLVKKFFAQEFTLTNTMTAVLPHLSFFSQRAKPDFGVLLRRFWKVAAPYWSSEDRIQVRWRFAGVLALTLATTGISVGFNLLGRDFYNALASKDEEQFVKQLLYYLGAFVGGIPVFVIRDYSRDKLALQWRAWMTKYFVENYFENRTFYNIQSQSLIDNPDQRIVDDLNSFTSTSLVFALGLFSAIIDLISFSGILYGIYPPLFAVLVVYSIGGTALSVALGKGLVGLNFMQEKREADFRYGLVRVRENAESIAFYKGEDSEVQLLLERYKQSFGNYSKLLVTSRNLDFFTSAYRYLIQLLPAAVVAPLFFSGKIEFGVINQSFSAFNHILNDFSIIVYQFQSISAFSAVVDRLGEFNDILYQQNGSSRTDNFLSMPSDATNQTLPKTTATARPVIALVNIEESATLSSGRSAENELNLPLLEIEHLTLLTPQYSATLVQDLTLTVNKGEHLLIMGASGSGKTSLLRALAGLWTAGKGRIKRCNEANGAAFPMADDGQQKMFFLPQRPYMVLGSLRQQILYPTWTEQNESILTESETTAGDDAANFVFGTGRNLSSSNQTPQPSDSELIQVLERVNLGHLMDGCDGLDAFLEWASVLSLGEQQKIAFARLLLSKPRLALLDESTSALDEENEIHLYQEMKKAGVTFISVGHRRTLQQFHRNMLRLETSQENESGRNWTLARLG